MAVDVRHPDLASAEKIAERPKTRRKPLPSDLGHWRNRWRVPKRHERYAIEQKALPLGDGTWLGSLKFPTREAAEDRALKYVDYNLKHYGIRYLGPEFFPDY
jgi:hypothetical protein